MKKETYNISCLSEQGTGYKPKEVQGYTETVKLSDNQAVKVAIRRNKYNNWIIEDYKAGLLICNGSYDTRKEALEQGIKRLEDNKDKIQEAREYYIKTHNIKLNY
jgi:hypothetical protein